MLEGKIVVKFTKRVVRKVLVKELPEGTIVRFGKLIGHVVDLEGRKKKIVLLDNSEQVNPLEEIEVVMSTSQLAEYYMRSREEAL